ncbi:MAG: hypothetical protein WAV51_04930 [Microgenomates group bacterium]
MDDESTSFEPKVQTPDIQYEETPVITPIQEQSEKQPETPPAMSAEEPMSPPSVETPVVPSNKRSPKTFIKGFFIFLILFIVGYALSGVIRTLITKTSESKVTTKTILTPTTAPAEILPTTAVATESSLSVLAIPKTFTTPTPLASSSAWKQYNPVHGTTRSPITTIQLSLPGTVLAPVCDGSSCGSQGTYLSGGTRLTIAPRGVGEVLADYRGKIISDASGKALITKETTVGGKKATEYTTDTTGSTVGGYTFTTMHGYMIEVTDTLSFEINHFSPSGITADFAADDAVFKSIVATITFK